jgi:ankyrin repeat protein
MAADWGETPLHRAAFAGDETGVSQYVAQGASLDARDILGFTALHVASAEGARRVR